jgi:hypothetical protein
MEETDELIKSKILRVLAKKNKWLHSHTPIVNIIRWVYVKYNGKRVKKMIKELKRENLIIIKPTHYGFEVSLNPRQKDIILNKIRKFFETEY